MWSPLQQGRERERKRKGTRTTRETKTYINRLRHKYTISQNNFNSPIRHQWMEPDKTYGENRMFMFTYEFFGTHTMFDFLYVAFSFDNWSHNDHCVNYIFFLSYSRFGSRCLTKTWNSYVNTNLLCVTQVGWCVSIGEHVNNRSIGSKKIDYTVIMGLAVVIEIWNVRIELHRILINRDAEKISKEL